MKIQNMLYLAAFAAVFAIFLVPLVEPAACRVSSINNPPGFTNNFANWPNSTNNNGHVITYNGATRQIGYNSSGSVSVMCTLPASWPQVRGMWHNSTNGPINDFWVVETAMDKLGHFNSTCDQINGTTGNFSISALGIDDASAIFSNDTAQQRDWWIASETRNRVYHVNNSGQLSNDPTGNFSLSALITGGDARGIFLTPRTGVPSYVWVSDWNDNLVTMYNTSGTQMANFSIPSGGGSIWSVWTVNTTAVPETFTATDAGNIIETVRINTSAPTISGTSLNQSYLPYGATRAAVGSVIQSPCFPGEVIVESNETGSLVNTSLSVFANSTTAINVNGTFGSNTLFDRIVSLRLFARTRVLGEGASSSFTLTLIPALLQTTSSAIQGNITSSSNNTHAQLSAAQSGRVNLTVAMPLGTGGNITACNYRTSGANRVRYQNQTVYCEVVINYTNSSGTASISIVDSSRSRAATPGGLPAVIGAATIGAIIVLYTYVRTRRKT